MVSCLAEIVCVCMEHFSDARDSSIDLAFTFSPKIFCSDKRIRWEDGGEINLCRRLLYHTAHKIYM